MGFLPLFRLYWQLSSMWPGSLTVTHLNHWNLICPESNLGRRKKTQHRFVVKSEAQISRLLKTGCNVIVLAHAGKMGRGISVHEWCCFSECTRSIALQHYLHSCCTLEFWSVLVPESHGVTPRKWEGRCVIDFFSPFFFQVWEQCVFQSGYLRNPPTQCPTHAVVNGI